MSEMLNSDQRQALTDRLRELCTELEAAIAANQEAGQTVELDQTRQGRLSRMDAMQGQAMAKATLARAKKQLAIANQKLEQIHHPEFGCCEECGEVIAFARLMSNPVAELCIQCAEALESN